MRLSVKESDKGYSKDAYMYEVYLDGNLLYDCFTADEELGEAHCYVKDDDNRVKLDNYLEIKTVIVNGTVKLVKVK